MASSKIRPLDPGFTAEIDGIKAQEWYEILQGFDDANIYQTWAYVAVTSGRGNMSHLVLRKDGEIAALALVRIAKLPLLKVGVAYVRWGPVWRRRGREADPDTFRQALRALRNEFACKRGLVLRLFPVLFDADSPCFSAILAEEGFSSVAKEAPGRTILMDLAPSLEKLREGMKPHWKRELKIAERKNLEVVEGSGGNLFDSFIEIYKEMVSRKHFVEPNDIHQFRMIQEQLPESLKMKVMLCRSSDGVCAGLICSAIGNTAIYLFGATSNAGMKSNGSYLLHWKLFDRLKQDGIAIYNLHGINPAKNPGTYKFKSDLAGESGRDVHFLGRFDSHAGSFGRSFVEVGERLRTTYRTIKGRMKAGRGKEAAPLAMDKALDVPSQVASAPVAPQALPTGPRHHA